jgi:predicted MPP superfamily phosphohydrolase
MLHRLVKALLEFGFTNFRGAVAIASSLGACACVAWGGWALHGTPPPVTLLAAFPLVYATTVVMLRLERRPLRALAGSRLEPIVQRFARAWVGCAFAAAFSTGALVVTALVWLAGQLALGGLAAEAGTASMVRSLGSGLVTLDAPFRALATVAMLTAGLAIGYGYTLGQRRVLETRLRLAIPNLPPDLHGLRLVHISDIHVGPYLPVARLAAFVARINALAPDLICITGDIVDHRLRDLDLALPALAGLRARYGVVAILGNHDFHVGADAIAARLTRGTDFVLLRDGTHVVAPERGGLQIIGIEDRGRAVNRAADEEARLQSLLETVRGDRPVILLAHRPDLFPSAAAAGVGLTLAGHTHGGQIALRFGERHVVGFGRLMSRFCRGLFERDGSFLYVTHGLGVVGQPVRLGVHREIVVVELVGRAGAPALAA